MSRRLFGPIATLATVVGLAIVIARIAESGDLRWDALTRPGTAAAAAVAAAATAAAVALRGLRWSVLLGPVAGMTRGLVVAGYAWCFLILQALPFRAGEVARPVWLRARGGSAADAVSSMIVERLIDISVLALILVAALASSPLIAGVAEPGVALAIVIVGLMGLLALALLAPLARSLIGPALPDASPTGLRRLLLRLLTHLSRAAGARRILPALLLSLLAWGTSGSAFVLLLTHLLSVDPVAGLALLAGVNLTAAITVSPGNIGVFESVAVAILAAYGVPTSDALAAAILLHLCVLAGQALAGIGARLLILRSDRAVLSGSQ